MITDLNYLKTMSGWDSRFITEMIGLFREQVEEYTKLMPELLEKEAYADLGKLAHKAKSSVSVMGMTETADLLKKLEILAGEGKSPERYAGMVNTFLEQIHMALSELEDV